MSFHKLPAAGVRVLVIEAQATFVSYSRDDWEFAIKLAEDLKAAGEAVWLDQLDIAPGQRWAQAVELALSDCPRLLVILSPSSAGSTNVDDEVSFALEEGKTVIPILYRDCKIPFRLRPLQCVDFRSDYIRGLKGLLGILPEESPGRSWPKPEDSQPTLSEGGQYRTTAPQTPLEKVCGQTAEQEPPIEKFVSRLVAILSKLKTPRQIIGLGIVVIAWFSARVIKPDATLIQFCIAGLFLMLCLAFNAITTFEKAARPKHFVLVLLAVVVLGVTTLLGAVFTEVRIAHERSDAAYIVRITVEGPDGNVIDGASIHSSVGGERLAVKGGFEFKIPQQDIPKDSKVEFQGTLPESFLTGRATLLFGSDHHPALKLHLYPDISGVVLGTVVEQSGVSIVGARVWVQGYDPVNTDAQGNFRLAAHAANGQMVRLFVAKGRNSVQHNILAGAEPQTIVLEER